MPCLLDIVQNFLNLASVGEVDLQNVDTIGSGEASTLDVPFSPFKGSCHLATEQPGSASHDSRPTCFC